MPRNSLSFDGGVSKSDKRRDYLIIAGDIARRGTLRGTFPCEQR